MARIKRIVITLFDTECPRFTHWLEIVVSGSLKPKVGSSLQRKLIMYAVKQILQLVYIFTSYTTINIIIHTIKCYKFNGYMFRSPLRPSSGQFLQIVRLQCPYNMGSHNVYIIFYIWTKITVKRLHC